MSKDNDDLTQVKQDRNFVNCHQEWEIDNLKQQGHSEEAINHCCSKDLGNNPRDKFEQCLIDFEKTKK